MKKSQFKVIGIALLFFVMLFSSCVNDLDQSSADKGGSVDAEEFFKDPSSYKQYLAKLYAGYATTGQNGPAGAPDTGVHRGMQG